MISYVELTPQQARIEFYNRKRDDTKWGEISPQRLVHYRDNWYLDALDDEIQQLRTFSLDCINQLKIIKQPAIAVTEETLDKKLCSSYRIFTGSETQEALLRFTPECTFWVARESWCPNQSGKYDG
ncbi:Transcriptional regulator [hydrothermal vent metagenome]|uniref:Transcriptional regulator n=1 Tax=hydrothermal vent metagenome TaxID=652676 RepID=A0A3B0YTW9_9ZZZZ